MSPLQAYLKQVKSNVKRGKFGDKMQEIADHIGCTKLRLSQTANPNDRHCLQAAVAMRLELYTDGLVPAETTCPYLDGVAEVAVEWLFMRSSG